MPAVQDFALYRSTQVAGFPGMPDGVAAQLDELTPALDAFDSTRATIAVDGKLTAEGKREHQEAARQVADTAIQEWLTTHTRGIDAQIAAEEAALRAKGEPSTPPSPLAVDMMARQLVTFDALEREAFYLGADDQEREVIEAAVASIGRQPVRRGDGALTWEPLISPERIATSVAARTARRDPETAARLDMLLRVRNIYVSMAATAQRLIER